MQKFFFFVWSFIHAVVCLFFSFFLPCLLSFFLSFFLPCLLSFFLSFFLPCLLSFLVGWLVGWLVGGCCSCWNTIHWSPMGLDYSNHPQMLHAATKEKTGLPETEGLKLFHSLTVFLYSTWLLRLFNVVYKGIIDDHTLQCLFQQVFFFEFWTRPQFLEHPFIQPFRRILLSLYTRWWFQIFSIFTRTLGKWSNLTSIFFKRVETTN